MHIGRVGALTVTAALLLSGCRWDGDDGRDHDPANRPAYARPAGNPDHLVRGPAVDGAHDGAFDLVDGADTVDVRVADLGSTLFEMSTPERSGLAPEADVDDHTVIARLRKSGRATPTSVSVLLSDNLRWTVRLSGGAKTETVDLSRGPGGNVDLTGGTSIADVALPAAPGTQTVTMRGGASELRVRLAGADPARVTAADGAGTVTIDGVTHHGVPGGALFAPPSWPAAPNRYDIAATAGVGAITVTRG